MVHACKPHSSETRQQALCECAQAGLGSECRQARVTEQDAVFKMKKLERSHTSDLQHI